MKGEIYNPVGGGDSHMKRTGIPLEILKKTSKSYQDPACGRRSIFCSPKEVPVLKHHIISCHIFFGSLSLKVPKKTTAVDLSRLNVLRFTASLVPKTYDEYLFPLCMGSPRELKVMVCITLEVGLPESYFSTSTTTSEK